MNEQEKRIIKMLGEQTKRSFKKHKPTFSKDKIELEKQIIEMIKVGIKYSVLTAFHQCEQNKNKLCSSSVTDD